MVPVNLLKEMRLPGIIILDHQFDWWIDYWDDHAWDAFYRSTCKHSRFLRLVMDWSAKFLPC